MKIKIKQDATYERDNWWKWSVWVEGDKNELASIVFVDYTLHPTFPKPIRRITDRRSKFRLDSAGWGEFMIQATLGTKGGGTKKLSHWLELKYPSPGKDAGRGKSATKDRSANERPVLFVSCNIADIPFANALNHALMEKNIDVLTQNDQPIELPWEAAMNSILALVNLVVFIVSDTPNTWMQREIEACTRRNIPIIPVVIMNSTIKLEDWRLDSAQAIRIKPVPPDKNLSAARHVAIRIHDQLRSILASAGKKRVSKSMAI